MSIFSLSADAAEGAGSLPNASSSSPGEPASPRELLRHRDPPCPPFLRGGKRAGSCFLRGGGRCGSRVLRGGRPAGPRRDRLKLPIAKGGRADVKSFDQIISPMVIGANPSRASAQRHWWTNLPSKNRAVKNARGPGKRCPPRFRVLSHEPARTFATARRASGAHRKTRFEGVKTRFEGVGESSLCSALSRSFSRFGPNGEPPPRPQPRHSVTPSLRHSACSAPPRD